MSFVAGNHMMFVLTVERELKKSPIWLINHGKELLKFVLVDRDSKEYARTYYEVLNQTLLTQNYRRLPPKTFYGLEAYGTH